MDAGVLYVRLRAVCCGAWGVPPWEFDAAAEAERVAVEDVLEAVLLRASEPLGGDVMGYVFRERAARKAERLERARALQAAFRAESDPERREAIRREMRRLNGKE